MGTVDNDGYYLAEEQMTEPTNTPRMTHNEQDVERVHKLLDEAIKHCPPRDYKQQGFFTESFPHPTLVALREAKAALSAMPCPHVHTSTEGTSYCSLAETTARRMNDIEQAAKGLREFVQHEKHPHMCEMLIHSKNACSCGLDKALAQYDATVKGE